MGQPEAREIHPVAAPEVPPEDAARLRATMAAYGRPVRRVGYWREGRGFNARCGLGRLEVTQQFLRGDRDAEECALAHEAGHRDGWGAIAAAALVVGAGEVALAALPLPVSPGVGGMLASLARGAVALGTAVGGLAALAAGCRRDEYRADLTAARIVGKERYLEFLADPDLAPDPPRDWTWWFSSWHPTREQRMRRVERASGEAG